MPHLEPRRRSEATDTKRSQPASPINEASLIDWLKQDTAPGPSQLAHMRHVVGRASGASFPKGAWFSGRASPAMIAI
jgi:hypothetical protein